MKLNLTRNTGFFGMGSPLKVFKNGQLETTLNSQGTTVIETSTGTVDLMVKFSFLQSEVYTIVTTEEDKHFQVRINPNIMKLYVSLFTLIFILPIIFRTWLLGVGILAIYLIFVAVMSRKFYLIEEVEAVESETLEKTPS